MQLLNFTETLSSPLSEGDPSWIGILQAVLLFFVLLLAIVGNFLVIAVVYRKRELRRSDTHIFIVNLSVTDISVALLCMPFSLITALNQKWIFSRVMCQLNGFLNVFFLLASILTLTAISIHKYVGIVQPLQRKFFTRNKVIIAVVWVWLQALLTALTPILGWNKYEYIAGRTQCSVKIPRDSKPEELTNCLFIIISGFAIPLGIMSFSYFKIFQTVRIHTKMVRSHPFGEEGQQSAFLNERQITTTLFIILAVFLACWSPFSVLTIYASLSGQKLPRNFSIAAYWLGFLNSAMNPLIYAFRNKDFRRGYRQIIKAILPCLFPSSDLRESSDSWPVLRGQRNLKNEAMAESETPPIANGPMLGKDDCDNDNVQYETASEKSSKENESSERNEGFCTPQATVMCFDNTVTIQDYSATAVGDKEVKVENKNGLGKLLHNGAALSEYLTPIREFRLPCSLEKAKRKNVFPNNYDDYSQIRRKSASFLSVFDVKEEITGRFYRSKSESLNQDLDKDRGNRCHIIDFHQQNSNPWLLESLSYLNKILPTEITGKKLS